MVAIRYGVSNLDQHRSAVGSALYPLFSLFGLCYNEHDICGEPKRSGKGQTVIG